MNKNNNAKKNMKISKNGIAILVAVTLILGYIFFECYSAMHVSLQTTTAVTSTVYETVQMSALAVRDERIVETANGGVTVTSVKNGEKVKKHGEIAKQFSSSNDAENYSVILALEEQLDHYLELEKQHSGTVTDIESINSEILGKVNEYIRLISLGKISDITDASTSINDTLIRRQMIIGENVDFTSMKKSIQDEINKIPSSKPSRYVNADVSGIFLNFTDGCEAMFDYKSIADLDISTLESYIEKAKGAKNSKNSMGKLVTSHAWYFCSVVNSSEITEINNGDKFDIAIKESDRILTCEVISGADTSIAQEKAVLVLKCTDMDAEIASYRTESIEIRYRSHAGIKVPPSAVHIVDGKKGVYVLLSGQVKFRQADVIYTSEDYVLMDYNPDESGGIRIYDEIITQGKDLYDGRVYA